MSRSIKSCVQQCFMMIGPGTETVCYLCDKNAEIVFLTAIFSILNCINIYLVYTQPHTPQTLSLLHHLSVDRCRQKASYLSYFCEYRRNEWTLKNQIFFLFSAVLKICSNVFLDIVYDHTLCMDGYLGSSAFLGKKIVILGTGHTGLQSLRR